MRNFYTQLETTLGSGISIVRALQLISNNLSSRSLKRKVLEMSTMIDHGSKLSEAMTRIGSPFTRMHVSFIKFGEETGCLDRVCGSLARHAEKELDLNRQVINSSLYPGFILVFAVIMGPVFNAIMNQQGVETAIVPAIINVVLLALAVGGVYGSYVYLGSGAIDAFLVHLPFFGNVFKGLALARFTRALSISQFAGVPLLQGLETSIDVCGNPWLQQQLKHLPRLVGQGKGIAAGLDSSGVIPGTLKEMILVGEQSGKLPEMLEKTAQYYEEEASNKITMLMKVLPIFIFIPVAIYAGYMIITYYQTIAGGALFSGN